MNIMTMTSVERVVNALRRRPVDRVPYFDYYWPETIERWTVEGHLKLGENIDEHFNQDVWHGLGINNTIANLDFTDEVLEETEDTILKLDGNGAKLRVHKKHSSTPEHVGYTVTNRQTWLEHIKPHLLTVDPRRYDASAYKRQKHEAAAAGRALLSILLGPFECMHGICGHEYLLMGMVEDPDWVRDMTETFVNLTIMLLEELYAKAGVPDGIYLAEDMGFKQKPFFSPAMYEQIMLSAHRRLMSFFHSRNIPVLLHSCGFIEPLVPGLITAGIDCLQPMEVKAGMDMLRLVEKFGDRISFCGNIDAMILLTNDLAALEAEMKTKIPPVIAKTGYLLHSDHSIPPQVNYETMKFFFQRGCEIGKLA
jgi:uroporphyrinogen decarboxylase